IADLFREYLLKHKHIKPLRPNRIVPLTGSLAKLVQEPSGPFPLVVVNGAPARGTVELLKGKAVGVDVGLGSSEAPVPVPLLKPVLVKTCSRVDSNGACTFELPAPDDSSYLAVVAKPGKRCSDKKPLVSYPISLAR